MAVTGMRQIVSNQDLPAVALREVKSFTSLGATLVTGEERCQLAAWYQNYQSDSGAALRQQVARLGSVQEAALREIADMVADEDGSSCGPSLFGLPAVAMISDGALIAIGLSALALAGAGIWAYLKSDDGCEAEAEWSDCDELDGEEENDPDTLGVDDRLDGGVGDSGPIPNIPPRWYREANPIDSSWSPMVR